LLEELEKKKSEKKRKTIIITDIK